MLKTIPMKVTVEISNYPLDKEYIPIIKDFIKRCKASGLTVRVNATSSQIQGDYNTVMILLQKEIKTSFERYGQMVFVMKVLKGELNLDFDEASLDD